MAGATATDPCRICEAGTVAFGRAMVLGKYDVGYVTCTRCGFVQTEAPHWLDEAYAESIAPIDIGPLDRALRMGDKTKALMVTLFDPWKPCLDFGAGFGLLVRRMRDLGLDFRYHDRHCENLFARGFESDPFGDERFELVTAFEVAEHLVDPVGEFGRLLQCTDNLLFSTDLLPAHRPPPGQWWYYVPDTGQHISFFTRRSLDLLAGRLGRRVYSRGTLHLLTRKRFPRWLYSLVTSNRFAARIGALAGDYRGLGSRLSADFARQAGTGGGY